jgi:hypothetical protein
MVTCFNAFLAYGLGIFTSSLLVTAFHDSIAGEQLLGSHFGVTGIPASYDYVILGGGTAGLALAHRLAEDARYTVAVVNAGDFAEFANGNFSQVPALASMFGGSNPFLKNPLLDFDQYTSAQPVSTDASIKSSTYHSIVDQNPAIERSQDLLYDTSSSWWWKLS